MKKIIYFLIALSLFTSCESKEVKTLSTDTMEDFQKMIADKPLILVDFNASWCGPCRELSPILDEIGIEQEDHLQILKINTDLYPNISTEMQIDGIPALILYKNNKLIWQHVGSISKEELNKIISENQ
jgi:thioredoxin 1